MGDTNRSFYYGAAIAARPWKYYGIRTFGRHLGIDVYAQNEDVQAFAYTFPFKFNAP